MSTLTNGVDYTVAKGGTLRITGDAVLTGTDIHNYMFKKNVTGNHDIEGFCYGTHAASVYGANT